MRIHITAGVVAGTRLIGIVFHLLIVAVAVTARAWSAGSGEPDARGSEVIDRLLEVNRHWLKTPPEAVRTFSYTYHLINKEPQHIEVGNPRKAPHAHRHGTTYFSMLHALAWKTVKPAVEQMVEEDGRIVLSLKFDPPVKGHCGNGLDGSWNGYFNLGGERGLLTIDAQKMVPLRSVLGQLEEMYSEYVPVDNGHFVPLSIVVEKPDSMRFEWKFRLYEQGLWLLDQSHYRSRQVAWIDDVKVNSAGARVEQATAISVAREKARHGGDAAIKNVLEANRQWLMPSLTARRGLVYEYRQEAPHIELILFDPTGNVMAELASNKESPDTPTRQRLWLPDGAVVQAEAQESWVRVYPPPAGKPDAEDRLLKQDRLVQHLAMGLALECALTKLAREPQAFGAEMSPVAGRSDRYLLVLHPKGDTRLFTGTMAMFTSWAYMHDVRYGRSQVLCDAATHRPLEENDFDGDELKGHYFFEDYMDTGAGAAPGRIRAVLPYSKDGKDQSLEMDARFRLAKPGVWLLDHVASAFRGGGGSTGTVQVVEVGPNSFEPVQRLIEKMQRGESALNRIADAPKGALEAEVPVGEWTEFFMQPSWTEKASTSLKDRDDKAPAATAPVIGTCRARVTRVSDSASQIEIEGVTTTYWKEFQTTWKASLLDGAGAVIADAVTNAKPRCISSPGAFTLDFKLAAKAVAANRTKLRIEGNVERMSGGYHGHGLWYTLSN